MKKDTAILVIDDDEQICFALGELFKFQGWRAYSACDVESGLATFKTCRLDMVLIDYHLPRINGVEGVRMLRRLSATVPIIVFTIDECQRVADEFLAAGASDFALKPIKAPDIISRVRLHLRLLEQQNIDISFAKGISHGTLELILHFLRQCSAPVTANDISRETGLAYQTVFRYLQHMTQQKLVDVESVYGKVGRPKQMYRVRPE